MEAIPIVFIRKVFFDFTPFTILGMTQFFLFRSREHIIPSQQICLVFKSQKKVLEVVGSKKN